MAQVALSYLHSQYYKEFYWNDDENHSILYRIKERWENSQGKTDEELQDLIEFFLQKCIDKFDEEINNKLKKDKKFSKVRGNVRLSFKLSKIRFLWGVWIDSKKLILTTILGWSQNKLRPGDKSFEFNESKIKPSGLSYFTIENENNEPLYIIDDIIDIEIDL